MLIKSYPNLFKFIQNFNLSPSFQYQEELKMLGSQYLSTILAQITLFQLQLSQKKFNDLKKQLPKLLAKQFFNDIMEEHVNICFGLLYRKKSDFLSKGLYSQEVKMFLQNYLNEKSTSQFIYEESLSQIYQLQSDCKSTDSTFSMHSIIQNLSQKYIPNQNLSQKQISNKQLQKSKSKQRLQQKLYLNTKLTQLLDKISQKKSPSNILGQLNSLSVKPISVIEQLKPVRTAFQCKITFQLKDFLNNVKYSNSKTVEGSSKINARRFASKEILNAVGDDIPEVLIYFLSKLK